MNYLVFNPKPHVVHEWINIYLSEPEISHFQQIIDSTCHHLDIIDNNKLKLNHSIVFANNSHSSPSLSELGSKKEEPVAERQNKMDSIWQVEEKNQKEPMALSQEKSGSKVGSREKRKGGLFQDEVRIETCIKEVKGLKDQFQQDYQDYLNKHISSSNSQEFPEIAMVINEIQDMRMSREVEVCQKHLRQLKAKTIAFYQQFLEEENQLIYSFVGFKIKELRGKLHQLQDYLNCKQNQKEDFEAVAKQVRILFDNLYIETDYLKMVIRTNCEIFEDNAEHDHSEDQPEVTALRQRQHQRLLELEQEVEEMKQEVRLLYFEHFNTKKKKRRIRDHNRLENHIKKEIAVNEDQFTKMGNRTVWFSGFIFALLLMAIIAIIIFRQVNLSELELETDYKIQFQIWRGASYIVWFSWVLAVVIFVMDYTGINYRMAMMEDAFFLEKYQSFFWSACVLTAIYLSLFLVYLLKKLGYIEGYSHLQHLGYYMWLINILYWVNPLKILNYHSRMYFLYLMGQNLVCLFRPMNLNIFLLAIILASCAQPVNDFSFTLCTLHTYDQKVCQGQARTATFIYLLVYCFFRIGQNIRFYRQGTDKKLFCRPNVGTLATILGTHTVIASYAYGNNDTHQMMIYWIVSAAVSTLTGINADFKADWGILTFEGEDCLLRTYMYYKKSTFYICGVIDAILNVTWVLTISNALNAFMNINVLYFFMLIQYIQFARKGLWMILRVQDDFALNYDQLRAIAPDESIREEVEQRLFKKSKKEASQKENNIIEEKGQNLHGSTQALPEKNRQLFSRLEKEFDAVESVENLHKINIQNGALQKKGEETHENNNQGGTKAEGGILNLFPVKVDKAQPGIFDLLAVEVEIRIEDIQAMVKRKKSSLMKVREFIETVQDYFKLISAIYTKLKWEDDY